MLKDVNLFSHALYCLFKAMVSKHTFAEPQRFSLNETATKFAENPGSDVLKKTVVKFAAFNDRTFQNFVGLLAVCHGGLAFVFLR